MFKHAYMQFLVKKGEISTPHADYCLPGITRATVSSLTFASLAYFYVFILLLLLLLLLL
jgi:hypothetical protein